ncbi:sigma factor-like helix-turn-helix DNA-binding protein, partial [Streptomyces caniscabiei]|uniref:sigma factor-like helix-turn-helix DNA-binding protein n=1 Tax=Streptomyces caniscabiei TaxID=2746961 RepID=UPI000B068CA2
TASVVRRERVPCSLCSRWSSTRALAALGGLPEGERAVVELVAVDQLSVTEAAAALGIRKVTARVRLHRARRALRSAAVGNGEHAAALTYAGGEA